jgi:hypothetical protein
MVEAGTTAFAAAAAGCAVISNAPQASKESRHRETVIRNIRPPGFGFRFGIRLRFNSGIMPHRRLISRNLIGADGTHSRDIRLPWPICASTFQ